MADNNEDLVDVLSSLRTALDNQRLDSHQAKRADKALLAELRKQNRHARAAGSNRAVHVAKRGVGALGRGAKAGVGAVGKAAGGFIGREIGGIPIAGAIFRILGKKFANASLERKQYKKTLIIRRKLEIKEMARMEKIKAKLDARREEAEAKAASARKLEDAQRDAGDAPEPKSGGKGGMSAAVEKMADAAMHMQATVISMTPAIQTFHETVEKMSEVVEAMHDNKANDASKVHDAKLLEYLHGIDYLTQENAAIAEHALGETKAIGKNISNIKWHTARQSNTVNRIEKLMQDRNKGGDNKVLELMQKDVGTIKWHVARLSGSSSRTEKLLVEAANDRIKELKNQETQIKMQKKQLDAAEESAGFAAVSAVGTIAGAATSAIGGLGTMAMAGGAVLAGGATALGGAVIAALPEILAAGAVVAAIGGVAYAVYKAIPSSWFSGADPVEAQNLESANKIAEQEGNANDPDHQTPEQQAYAKKYGRYATQNTQLLSPPTGAPQINGQYQPLIRSPVLAPSPENEAEQQLTQKSAEVEAAKSGSGGSGSGGPNINAPTTSIQNQTTVQPGVMSASPYETQQRQREIA
jgi:hypothetical protein